MIVYVESNFVLELAFAQEEHEACGAILDLAEDGRIDLAIPAFSVAEPYDVLRRREGQRSKLHEDVTRELGQLSRTESYAEEVVRLDELLGLLIRSSKEQRQRLDDILIRSLATADLIAVRPTSKLI